MLRSFTTFVATLKATRKLSHLLNSSRRLTFLLLAVFTLLLTLISAPSIAQATQTKSPVKAPVVLDGRVLFQVGNAGNSIATERAESINTAIEQELLGTDTVTIEVTQENQRTILKSKTSNRNLLTVTEEDVITGSSATDQGNIWRLTIEQAIQEGKTERTPRYYTQALVYSIGVLLGAIASHFALVFFWRVSSHQLSRWLSTSTLSLHPWEQPAKLFLQLAILGLEAGLWSAVAFYITDIFPQARSLRYQLKNFLTSPVVTLGESNYSALQLLLLLGFTVGLWFAVSTVTQLFKSYVLGRTSTEPRVQEVIAILTQYILTFLGLIVLLQIWGLDVRSLAILASVLGVGIGFGVQNITNNLISGLIITIERPIQIGDFIKVGDLMGIVERIGSRSTEIRTLDQVTIIVPNSRFLEKEVINWSHGDPVSRMRISVGVAYGSDVDKVQKALLEAAKSHPEVLLTPPPQVWFQEFGESAIQFDLLVWTGEPKNQFRVKSDLYYRIEASLRRYDIEVPFPKRDLNVRSPQLEELLNAWLNFHIPNNHQKKPMDSSNEEILGDRSQHTPRN